MRRWIAAAIVAALGAGAGAQEETKEDDATVVREWLVLAPVDVVARRPLRPDAVFAKHLLDRASAPPRAGDEVTGTLGKPAAWKSFAAKDDGEVGGDEAIGWAYARVESAQEKVVLAKLEGAQTLFVNGTAHTGDVYRLGDVGVPVLLRKGANDVYVAGTRGGFRLSWTSPKALTTARLTVPDLSAKTPWAYSLLNASSGAVRSPNSGRPDLVPLGIGRIDIDGSAPRRMSAHGNTTFVDVKLPHGGSLSVAFPDRGPNEPIRRTFVSKIDGSVQSYAVLPPLGGAPPGAPLGLVLSLHGAGVDCMDQARAYAPKPDFWIVCPTNRGRYGFDWQDWGRLDAYEVLEDALKVTGVDPRRVYLTGHSMGGHGTWHLAANDPGRFLAIAPSAGWSSFESYGGGAYVSPLAWMWRAADGASRTLDLVANLAQVPTYVLHGENDDDVPASEARLMLDAIVKAGGKPQSHFEPGARHWWDKDEKRPGADCVDWPGVWELFRRTPPPGTPLADASVLTAEPSWFGRPQFHWGYVEQPLDDAKPSRLTAHLDMGKRVTSISTDNARRVRVASPVNGPEGPMTQLVVDGQPCAFGSLVRVDSRWRNDDGVDPTEKRSVRRGPFKRAFVNRFVLVYGTAGDDAEDRELLEKARFDSFVWAYRANGDANLMSDAQFLEGDFTDGNVILYGNADTNAAWSAVFDDDCPIQAKRGSITVGGAKHEGVLAAAFVRPRKGSDVALAAAFADTGAAATRLFYAFPVFVSGVGIPDYVVFGAGYLRELDGDVRAAGWFDHAWNLR